MYVLNGLRTPANVLATPHARLRRRMDPGVTCMPAQGPWPADAILVNPLNLLRSPSEQQDFRARAGDRLHRTAVAWRPICRWIPALRDPAWAVRKPPAEVLSLRPGQADGSGAGASTAPVGGPG